MLNIYADAIVMLERLAMEITTIERHDSDLARQLRRAGASVVLNIAEGSYARGRNRKALYNVALGSAKEVRAGLDVARVPLPRRHRRIDRREAQHHLRRPLPAHEMSH